MSLIETYKMSIGCGDPACVNKTNLSFCSRSCKKAAILDNYIKDIDINYKESNLSITPQAHTRLFGIYHPVIIEEDLPKVIQVLGCGDESCVSKTNRYFCSRSCKNAAIRDLLINDNTDIDHKVSNLLLTIQAHDKLFN
jgi:hypothetical protein